MSFRKKAVQVTIAGSYVVTVDAEDVDKVQALTWQRISGDQSRPLFKAVVGSERMTPVEQLLGGFILGIRPDVYVCQQDPGATFNYRKSNLRIHTPRAPRQ